MGKRVVLHGAIRPPFDYSIIADRSVVATLAQAGERIRRIQQAALIDVGTELCRVKAHLEHGQFRAWLNAETDLSPATANRLMQVAENIGPDKWITVRHLPPGVIYQLASPSTSATVLETLAAVPAGEMVSTEVVKHLITSTRNSENRAEAKAKRKAVKVGPAEIAKAEKEAEKQAKRDAAHHKEQVTEYGIALDVVAAIEDPLGADLTKVFTLLNATDLYKFRDALRVAVKPDTLRPKALDEAMEKRKAKQRAA